LRQLGLSTVQRVFPTLRADYDARLGGRAGDVTDLYDAIPKVELHCHVEGTVRPATVIELARKAGRPLPVKSPLSSQAAVAPRRASRRRLV